MKDFILDGGRIIFPYLDSLKGEIKEIEFSRYYSGFAMIFPSTDKDEFMGKMNFKDFASFDEAISFFKKIAFGASNYVVLIKELKKQYGENYLDDWKLENDDEYAKEIDSLLMKIKNEMESENARSNNDCGTAC